MGIRTAHLLWWTSYDCCYSPGEIGLFVLMSCETSHMIKISIFLIACRIPKSITFSLLQNGAYIKLTTLLLAKVNSSWCLDVQNISFNWHWFFCLSGGKTQWLKGECLFTFNSLNSHWELTMGLAFSVCWQQNEILYKYLLCFVFPSWIWTHIDSSPGNSVKCEDCEAELRGWNTEPTGTLSSRMGKRGTPLKNRYDTWESHMVTNRSGEEWAFWEKRLRNKYWSLEK